jgi:hypothetical protein
MLDYKMANNETVGFDSIYGNMSTQNDIEKRTQAPGIRPGEMHLFKIPPHQPQNFIKLASPDRVSFPPVHEIELNLYKILYRDGTGYLAGKPAVWENGSVKWVGY